jgi:hypothetical protein
MKNLVKITLVLFCCALMPVKMEAQIKKNKKGIPTQTLPQGTLNGNLNLERIKQHLKNNKMCYVTTVSTTAIFDPKHPKPVTDVVGYFVSNELRQERDYLRVNAKLLRQDSRFSSSRADNYEVLIYPQRSKKDLVDVNRVKLTWRSPEKGLKTFLLQNVHVQYKPYGILITGDYLLDGALVGVSIGLMPEACLI